MTLKKHSQEPMDSDQDRRSSNQETWRLRRKRLAAGLAIAAGVVGGAAGIGGKIASSHNQYDVTETIQLQPVMEKSGLETLSQQELSKTALDVSLEVIDNFVDLSSASGPYKQTSNNEYELSGSARNEEMAVDAAYEYPDVELKFNSRLNRVRFGATLGIGSGEKQVYSHFSATFQLSDANLLTERTDQLDAKDFQAALKNNNAELLGVTLLYRTGKEETDDSKQIDVFFDQTEIWASKSALGASANTFQGSEKKHKVGYSEVSQAVLGNFTAEVQSLITATQKDLTY